MSREIVLVTKEEITKDIGFTVLEIGDVVEFTDGDHGLLVSETESSMLVVDLDFEFGNRYGTNVKEGTTVAEYNNRFNTKIAKVFKKGDYGLKLEL